MKSSCYDHGSHVAGLNGAGRLLFGLALLVGCGNEAPVVAPPPIVSPSGDVLARGAIVILVDALRADHLGVYGYGRPTSPVIDGLAAQGVVFRNARTASPWTLSSTASLMTGLLPTTHGAGLIGEYRNEAEKGREVAHLDRDLTTIAEVAVSAGFKTALFARNGYLGYGSDAGFETVRNPKTSNAAKQVDVALAWLDELAPDDRFLLFVHFMDVHAPSRSAPALRPLFPPLDVLDEASFHYNQVFQSEKRSRVESPTTPIKRYREARVATYDAAIRTVDLAVGRLMAEMDPNLRSQSLLVVTADHGEEFWDHVALEAAVYPKLAGHVGEGHGHTFFDEVLRIPLILVQPDVLPPGTVTTPVANVDIAPTLLEALGLPAFSYADGRSLLGAAKGAPIEPVPMLVDEVCFGYQKRGLLSGDYKYIWSVGEPALLFDLAVDPGETHNLVASRPELVTQMHNEFVGLVKAKKLLGQSLRLTEEAPVPMTDEDIEALRGLGYLEDEK